MKSPVARLGACLLAVAASLPLSSFAAAQDLVRSADYGHERDWAKVLLNDDKRAWHRLEKALKGERRRAKALAALQHLAHRDAFVGLDARGEARLRQLVLPGYETRFDRQIDFDGRRIVQDRSLIDPERAPWSTVSYTTLRQVGTTEQIGLPVHVSKPPTPMRNAARMRNGQAPFGPDNREVLLCRLLDNDRAPYYEVREGEVSGMLVKVGNSNFAEACLGADQAKTYWKARHGDFVNVLGAQTWPASE